MCRVFLSLAPAAGTAPRVQGAPSLGRKAVATGRNPRQGLALLGGGQARILLATV